MSAARQPGNVFSSAQVYLDRLARELSEKALELTKGMRDRTGRDPDALDYERAFKIILDRRL